MLIYDCHAVYCMAVFFACMRIMDLAAENLS